MTKLYRVTASARFRNTTNAALVSRGHSYGKYRAAHRARTHQWQAY